ncbi:hypothetical protein WNY37_07265 [Henriciella sp. AS95]|uniref:DUF1330 domain-containing protein n=1 Tax=Henriciella sp. AS95 TaxID=3135782 RepID=UPI00316CDD2F
MPAMQPTTDQMRRFAKDVHDGPIVMVNLLKFKTRAEYQPDDPEYGEPITGAEAYWRYNDALFMFSAEPQIGLEIVYDGPVAGMFIGDGDWDKVLVVRYPSRKHFLAMTSDPRYQDAHRHRAAGLLHQDLIETRPDS